MNEKQVQNGQQKMHQQLHTLLLKYIKGKKGANQHQHLHKLL